MSYCHNCPCDSCHFERNPVLGPERPPECRDCGARVERFMYWCDDCKEKHRQKWLQEIRTKYINDPTVISKERHDEMMMEAHR